MGDETFLAPSGPCLIILITVSHHQTLRWEKWDTGADRAYNITSPVQPLPRDFILPCRIFLKILLNFCESFIKSCPGNSLSLYNVVLAVSSLSRFISISIDIRNLLIVRLLFPIIARYQKCRTFNPSELSWYVRASSQSRVEVVMSHLTPGAIGPVPLSASPTSGYPQ